MRGFGLIELIVVIAIIGVLGSVVMSSVGEGRKQAYVATAKQEMRHFQEALELYLIDHGDIYPADVNRDIPAGIEEYLNPGDWPSASWPGSVYDWDNWDDPDTGEPIIQLSVRFCEIGDPSSCNFPDEEWASDFDSNSSAYWCIEGACRAHINEPIEHPGYCLNCEQ